MRGKNTKFLLSCTAFLFLCMLACAVCVASARTIFVPDDYAKIQWAVSNASTGDTIFVRNGTYAENVVVNKPLTLQGEDRNTTIIDGGGYLDVIRVTAKGVSISGFTVRNSGSYYGGGAGIYLSSGFNMLVNNIIMYNRYGIHLDCSDGNEIIDNIVSKNRRGIYLDYHKYDGSDSNVVINNNILDNIEYGIHVSLHSDNNKIYHNNIIDNVQQAYDRGDANSWNESYPIGGNYWSDHTCTGNPSNGSQPYRIDSDSKDWYPFEDPDGWVTKNKPPIASFTYTPENPFVNQTITFDASSSYDPDGTIVSYEWDFGDGNTATGKIVNHAYSSAGKYTVTLTVTENSSAKNSTSKIVTVIPEVEFFDTGPGTYPSIFGTHKGTIKPNKTIIAEKLYTYPCAGTGGHTEYARIYNDSWSIETLPWEGYGGDWHNLSFTETFKLYANVEYNFTIRTGSYPQIHHNKTLQTQNGWINCTEFTDANGNKYEDWIPAIKLW